MSHTTEVLPHTTAAGERHIDAVTGSRRATPNLSVAFAGVHLKNPLVLASGTCGFGREYERFFAIGKLGGLCSKGLTLKPLEGNSGVRVWETRGGMMNSVGLENPGVDFFIKNELPFMRKSGAAVIVNLGGHSIDDYCAAVEKLNDADADIIELNISCPNVAGGGMVFGVNTETARTVVRSVRAVCKHPLLIKLSPNAEDIVALARMCEEEGADAVSLVNTFLAFAIDLKRRRSVFDNGYAGLSGPAIKPIALRMVHQVAHAVNIPVMGMGGITTWQDAAEFLLAGARAIQIGTANLSAPAVSLDILDGLTRYLESEGMQDVAELHLPGALSR